MEKDEQLMKRVFLIVLDSVGIGNMDDAADYGDAGSNTLLAASKSTYFSMPHMAELGLLSIDGVEIPGKPESVSGSFCRLKEKSKGKDTTIGHWEIAGIISGSPLPVYPEGFPEEVLEAFTKATGRGILCNRPYSGTEVIKDYGEEHLRTGDLIVYTSADSVFQIAAHEEKVPVEQLYEYCRMARKILTGKHGVGRVIARPFTGEAGNFTRTSNRHDFSLEPPGRTMLDQLQRAGKDVIGVGKIVDIFANVGISRFVRTINNADGIQKTLQFMDEDFEGLCFINLVDYDMLYGHRNDVDGYAKALTQFDGKLPEILGKLAEDDILMITADHGCDPSTPSTDHSREMVPLVIYGNTVKENNNLGTRESFADIGATILEYFGISPEIAGDSFLDKIIKH